MSARPAIERYMDGEITSTEYFRLVHGEVALRLELEMLARPLRRPYRPHASWLRRLWWRLTPWWDG